MKLIGKLSFVLLLMAVSATSAQNSPVLDTSGQPLRCGVKYIIKLAITDNGGPFTLINRNGSCPLYVGQRNVTADGIPVTFAPFDDGESVVRELSSFKVSFSGASTCVLSTTWKVEQDETVDGRRLIATGDDAAGYSNYFLIDKSGDFDGVYKIDWCPADLCPTCKFRCGSLGSLFENGQLLAALDGSALPLVFDRA